MEPCSLTYDICLCYVRDFSGHACLDLETKVLGYLRARDLPRLASCTGLYDWAKHTINDWRYLRQIEAFFKKNAAFVNKDICSSAAKASFFDAEASCSATNARLKPYINSPHLLGEKESVWVSKMKLYIDRVLGDFDHFRDDLPYLLKVTPGATSTRSRRNSLPQMKMRLKTFATARASKYVWATYCYYGFNNVRIKRTYTNRVELVPKNWKTDRTIACEPDGMLPFQLAFDRYAKGCLKRHNIDLSDQFSNQSLAKRASKDGSYATVDFKAASDTISYNTVSLVFPPEWFEFLDDVRSPCYRGAFGNGIYAKFSSMGNGSTFTIETLLFAAACYAVGCLDFRVYGDDVILPTQNYEDFLQLTRFLGFTVNSDKTFTSGPFRESCGGDYFNGIDVTPVYVRSVDGRKVTLCHLVNTLRGVAFPGMSLWKLLNSLIADYKLPLVPYNKSTISGIWIDPDKARRLKILRKRFWIDQFRSFTADAVRREFVDSRGYYLWFLYKNSQVLFSQPWNLGVQDTPGTVSRTSSASIFSHKYVRKWVCWLKPTDGTPSFLFWDD